MALRSSGVLVKDGYEQYCSNSEPELSIKNPLQYILPPLYSIWKHTNLMILAGARSSTKRVPNTFPLGHNSLVLSLRPRAKDYTPAVPRENCFIFGWEMFHQYSGTHIN